MHRLLLLTENYPPDRGGMAESCDRIVRNLRARGVVIDVVHFDRRTTTASFRAVTNGSHLRWPVEINASHAINCLWNRLRRSAGLEAITHVAAFGGAMPVTAAPMIAALMRRPLITLLRGSEFDAGMFDARRRTFLDDALRRSTAVCAVTTEQEEKVLALYEGTTVYRVGNGIDLDAWQPAGADRPRAGALRAAIMNSMMRSADIEVSANETRQSETENAPVRIIGMFGNLKAKKGVPFFLDVLRRGFHHRFHIVMAGELDEQLAAFVDANRELAITLLPSRDRYELIPLYLACDFVAIPSHYDGFPNVLIESGALGIPSISSATGGMRDILEDGRNAIVFEPGDEHDCRRAINQASHADEEAIHALGSAAQLTIRKECSSEREADGYLRVLDQTARVVRSFQVQR
jgi:glycogen(starch) synthase